EPEMIETAVSVHLVYSLTATEFKGVVNDLVSLRKESHIDTTSLPIDVNPIMSAQGLKGPYATGVRRVIVKHAGAGNLSRVAFVGARARPTAQGALASVGLDGGHFDVRGGQLVPRMIASTGQTLQGLSFDIVLGPEGPETRFRVAPVMSSSD